jgi:hypothetical protein
MNPRIPRYSDHETEILKDMAARIIVELTEADLPEEARTKAMGVVLETSRTFIYEKPKPILRLIKNMR